jgi:hypothetical protein
MMSHKFLTYQQLSPLSIVSKASNHLFFSLNEPSCYQRTYYPRGVAGFIEINILTKVVTSFSYMETVFLYGCP